VRPGHPKYFNYKIDIGKIASCRAVIGRKLLTLPGVVDTYMFSMITWNTLLESYQLMVYKNTLATVKRQIQHAENTMPAMVSSVEAARFDDAILLHYMTSEVALEEPEIRGTDPNNPIDHKCMVDKLHFWIPLGSRDYVDEGDKSDERDAIPTAHWQQRPVTELERNDLGTSDVDGYEGEDGHDVDVEVEAVQSSDGSTQTVEDGGNSRTSNIDGDECKDGDDADQEEAALQVEDGSTQNVEDWRHCGRECEDWTVHFKPVKYNTGEANATASDVSTAMTVF